MKIVVFGLTITSAWGNGHATTFRSLIKALHGRGHKVTFVEKDVSWYRDNRDLTSPPFCTLKLYDDWNFNSKLLVDLCRDADAIIIGSYFPDAKAASEALISAGVGPLFFYDIDTPVTLAALRATGSTDYLDNALVPLYDGYLSFTGGPILTELCEHFGAQRAFPFYCSVDPDIHKPTPSREVYRCDLSYLGTYSSDRQPKLNRFLSEPASLLPQFEFVVAGALYPDSIIWNANVKRFTHVAPADHAGFYSSAKFTLNLTREDMVISGYSPSVRLFEASACGAAIISDDWQGIDDFFTPGEQILLPRDERDVIDIVSNLSDAERLKIGKSSRERTLEHHTSAHRAIEFEQIVSDTGSASATRRDLQRSSGITPVYASTTAPGNIPR